MRKRIAKSVVDALVSGRRKKAPPLSFRFDLETIVRLDELALTMSERVAGVRITRSDVIRVALERGIVLLEKEYG